MTSTELTNEGRSEHALHLCGIEGAGIFASSFKGVEGRIEVAGRSRDIAARCLVGGAGAGERFDFLLDISIQMDLVIYRD